MKEQQLLKEFNNKRIGGKYVEEELIREMSKCKHLAETMNKVADLLKKREDIVTAKELKVCHSVLYSYLLYSIKIIFIEFFIVGFTNRLYRK